MKLHTRKEIIDIWLQQESNFDKLCCPNCRDLLFRLTDNEYFCGNSSCALFEKEIIRNKSNNNCIIQESNDENDKRD